MSDKKDSKAVSRAAIIKLVLLVLVTAAVFALYRVLMTFKYFEFVLAAYMVALTALIIAYFIYNRGMSRRGVTEEMLPDGWSEEQKKEYIEDGKRRQKRSSWMLIFIFALIFTFAFDLIELYLLPFIDGLLTR